MSFSHRSRPLVCISDYAWNKQSPDRQTNKYADRQVSRQTGKQTRKIDTDNIQTERRTDKLMGTNTQIHEHRQIQTDQYPGTACSSSIHPSVCASACASVRASVCLSMCLCRPMSLCLGSFPNWTKVVPLYTNNTFQMPRRYLISTWNSTAKSTVCNSLMLIGLIASRHYTYTCMRHAACVLLTRAEHNYYYLV